MPKAWASTMIPKKGSDLKLDLHKCTHRLGIVAGWARQDAQRQTRCTTPNKFSNGPMVSTPNLL